MNNSLPPEILQLTTAEKIQLVEDIWDSIASTTDAIELTPAQQKELDVRLEQYHQNPNSGSTWNQVKQRILNNNE